jgi:acyl-CoA synthetase (AMP-forming)/AMP-acid ligase II
MNASAVTRFGDLTDAAAARWGDREALVFRQRRYSFRQIAAEVDRVARGLIRAGVRPGEKVAIWLVNCPEWIFTMFALAKISCRATTVIPSRPRVPSMPTDGSTPAMPASCVRTAISDSSAATRT